MKEKLKTDKRKSQKERFIEGAKLLEVEDTGEKFNEMFARLIPEKKPEKPIEK